MRRVLAALALMLGLIAPMASTAGATQAKLVSRAHTFSTGDCRVQASFPDTIHAQGLVVSGSLTCKYVQVQAFGYLNCGCIVYGSTAYKNWPLNYSKIVSNVASPVAGMIIKLDDGVYGLKAWHFFTDGSYY
jgi:hypothetical protein